MIVNSNDDCPLTGVPPSAEIPAYDSGEFSSDDASYVCSECGEELAPKSADESEVREALERHTE